MTDAKKLKARFEELKGAMEVGLFGAIGSEDVDAVLELIREAEPRVMTLEEVETSEGFVWVEFHSINENRLSLEYVNVRVTERFLDSFVLATDSGIEWLRHRGDYNRGIWFGINSGWRCWSARPTEEQREAVKWDET